MKKYANKYIRIYLYTILHMHLYAYKKHICISFLWLLGCQINKHTHEFGATMSQFDQKLAGSTSNVCTASGQPGWGSDISAK